MSSVAMPDEIVLDAVDHRDDAPGARPHDPHDAFHERALAVAVGAEQRHGLAVVHGERDAVEHLHRAVARAEVLDADGYWPR